MDVQFLSPYKGVLGRYVNRSARSQYRGRLPLERFTRLTECALNAVTAVGSILSPLIHPSWQGGGGSRLCIRTLIIIHWGNVDEERCGGTGVKL